MKKVLSFLIVLALLGGGAYYFRGLILPSGSGGSLRIVLSTEATSISPYALNLNNGTRIRNIYEGLVAFDRNLKIIPALAVSWGNTTDTTWEFRLREGVLFHDDSPFTAQDVIDAYEKARASGDSQIKNYIDTIKSVEIASGNRIIVNTTSPDPLLLSKLTKLFVHKEGNVGTGPYRLGEWERGKYFKLEAFDSYWGPKPAFKDVSYDVINSRVEREQAFSAGNIDILVGLTEEQALELPSDQVVTSYGLEVNFLMFQLDDPVFEDKSVREAFFSFIDPAQVEDIGNNFVRHTNQFIAPGVFGYNQSIPDYDYDPENEARDLFGSRLERLNFDYLSTYRTLSEYLNEKMRQAGFSVQANAVEPDQLLEKISRNGSQLFLIGWRAEDGDAGSFYNAFIHSDGPFNGGRYSNPDVDKLIEESRTEMNPQTRLSLLQRISSLVSEDVIGIPLFETSRLYAIGEDIIWQSRLDGEVLAFEVK